MMNQRDIRGLARITRCGAPLIMALSLSACIIGAGGDPPAAVDARPDAPKTCENAVATVGDGKHFPGENCLACHDSNLSDGAPEFSLGGTLYNGPSGLRPVPNATIIVIDANNRQFLLPTQQNGNFFSAATMAFPVRVSASQCPKTKPMLGLSAGNCNAGGCHAKGDPAGRIYLQVP